MMPRRKLIKLAQFGNALGVELAFRVSLLITVVLTVIGLTSSMLYIRAGIESMVMGQSANFIYWLNTNDRYQIDRTLASLADMPNVHTISLIDISSKRQISAAESEQPEPKYAINLREKFDVLNSIGEKQAVASITYLLPIQPLIQSLIVGLICFVVFALYFDRKARRLVGEVTEPVAEFVERIKSAVVLEDLAQLDLQNSNVEEFNALGKVVKEMGARIQRAELQLREAQRNEIFYKMTRQVAHDIRSPLSALMILSGKEELISEADRSLITAAAKRIDKIAGEVLNAAREAKAKVTQLTPKKKTPMEDRVAAQRVAEILHETVVLKNVEFNAPQRVRCGSLNREKCSVLGSEEALTRILSNLINNAQDALGEKDGYIEVSSERDHEKLLIRIRDNGCGISPKAMHRLGSEGHTTKAGCGVGLWHARQTLKKWRGRLDVDSQLGVGTTVTITLAIQERGPQTLSV